MGTERRKEGQEQKSSMIWPGQEKPDADEEVEAVTGRV